MKNKWFKIVGIGACLMLAGVISVMAQGGWKNDKYRITIKGTSTLHDWHMEVKMLQVEGLVVNGESDIQIVGGKVIVPVKSLESGNGLMNSKTYNALRADKFPNIEFTLKQFSYTPGNRNNGEFLGTLTIGGIKREVKIQANCTVQNNTITIAGSYPLNMRDYLVEPPTAMMGTLKTGELVTIEFFIQLKKD